MATEAKETKRVGFEQLVRAYITTFNSEQYKGVNTRIPAGKAKANIIAFIDGYYKGVPDFESLSVPHSYTNSSDETINQTLTKGQAVLRTLANQGKIILSPRKGGIMVYLPEDKPKSASQAVSMDTIKEQLGI